MQSPSCSHCTGLPSAAHTDAGFQQKQLLFCLINKKSLLNHLDLKEVTVIQCTQQLQQVHPVHHQPKWIDSVFYK